MLAEHFSEEDFHKSQVYGKDKAKFALVSGLYKQAVDSLMLHYGLFAWAWDCGGQIVTKLGYSSEYEVCTLQLILNRAVSLFPLLQILQSIAFVCVVFFVSSIPSIPFSIYQTFFLEEKHGFNKTTPELFFADLLKGWAIGFVIGAPFLAAFLYVFKWAGDRFVPWLMGFL